MEHFRQKCLAVLRPENAQKTNIVSPSDASTWTGYADESVFWKMVRLPYWKSLISVNSNERA